MSVVFVIFIAIATIQFCYLLFIFSRFSYAKQVKAINTDVSVSVLICARNESKNLQKCLPAILNQNYPNFEVVLINDGSDDDTLKIFETFQGKYQTTHQIKIIDALKNEKRGGNKKQALTLGIKAATNEYLLFTDADCQPASKHWISNMVSHFSDKKEIILGYGAHQKIKNSLLNKLIRFETLYTALQYFSYAKIGLPYMGIGRNLGYKKSLFLKTDGFTKHSHLKSGDDDLFINQNATNKNVAIVFTPNSFTISKPKTTFKSWVQQKRRHISTANNYKTIHKLLLGLSYSSQLLFWLFASTLLIAPFQWELILIIIGIRMITQYIIIGIASKKLKEQDLIIWIPFFEIFLIFIQLFIFIKNKISKPTHW